MKEQIHIHVHISILSTSIVTICFLSITTLPQSHCQQPVHDYSICREQSYSCGNLLNIFYPFWGHNRPSYCGGGDQFNLTCHNGHNTTTIAIGSQDFTVLDIIPEAHSMMMKRTDLAHDVCSPQFNDTDLSPGPFRYPQSVDNITLFYNCSAKNLTDSMCGPQNAFGIVGAEDGVLKVYPELKRCGRHIQVPTGFPLKPRYDEYYDVIDRDRLDQVLDVGFHVNYAVNEECMRCLGSAGDCPDDSTTATRCSVLNTAHKGMQLNGQRKIILGVGSAAMTILLMCIIIICFRCKSSTRSCQVKFRFMAKNNQDIEAFLKNYGALSQKRYKFSQVKKMTNSFKVKLGQGGFGAVYKGILLNGCPVAVKILNASKGNGKEFINEVASISRTSHVNVVTLLGFCFEGRKKALIYEFMPNGSLDNFIYNKGPKTITSLSWDNLFQIAKGIARGLEYLHRGCNTRILHFDIKPHNIILDENFCPKISDFGLAKLCPRKESIISMSNVRGTIGYVAPEVWNRHFGGVSHKSDVYSFGMMLLEMVGGRKNINAEASQASEIYFPHWVYNRLEMGSDLRPDGVMATEEIEIARRMTIVGLWCIQTFPNSRPTMSRVVDMLEGSMDSLEIPPKPMLSSPTRSESESSTL